MGPKSLAAPVSTSTSFSPVLIRYALTEVGTAAGSNERSSSALTCACVVLVSSSPGLRSTVPSLSAVISKSPSIIR